MCDTMVALGSATKDGVTLFAKNSDRQPNEAHLLLRIPRRTHTQQAKVKCTYIEIDQVPQTYEVILLKPSWIWGCEMGANEFGLNIGNEAVFTKEKQGDKALIGMDMVRLALERCKSSREALDLIVNLLDEYGQGGNCGYEKNFVYHNSFLIADADSAWVLETAGQYWAAEKVKDVRSISNRLSIGSEFDLCHPRLIEHAINQGWCKSQQDFHFARCYTEPVFTHFSGSKERQETTSSRLDEAKGRLTPQIMMEILRSHTVKADKNPFQQASLKSVCMHAGFVFGDHCTGSYVASIHKKLPTYWVTGSSTPCISVFKPYWLLGPGGIFFEEGEEAEALAYWHTRERFHRMVLENKIPHLAGYLEERDALEAGFFTLVEGLNPDKPNRELLNKIMEESLTREEELIERLVGDNEGRPARIRGNIYFRNYWRKQNSSLRGT